MYFGVGRFCRSILCCVWSFKGFGDMTRPKYFSALALKFKGTMGSSESAALISGGLPYLMSNDRIVPLLPMIVRTTV